jgi:putative transposase
LSQRNHEIPHELLGSLLANYNKPEVLIGWNGLFTPLAKLLLEKALEMDEIKVSSSSSGAPRAVRRDAR